MKHSDKRRERVVALLKSYSAGKTSHKEERELFGLIDIDKDENVIREYIESLASERIATKDLPEVDWEALYETIVEKKRAISANTKVRRMFPVKWVAAAAVIFLLGAGYYFLTNTRSQSGEVTAKTGQATAVDVAPPASANAVLTLANGQTIVLDSAGNGTIVQQGSMDVVKLADGQIAYKGAGRDAGYNTLSNPKGSKVINLTLSDGSKVWLNVASAIRYPVAFISEERRVEITGEAYFEVAHNPSRPFIVSKGGTSVRVLGTHFNVEAYDDERTLNVTLLEGSVRVSTAENVSSPKVIRPGEQAQVKEDGAIALAKSVDLNGVMAWKNDMFLFNGVDIETIMRQVSRWYNVDVVFEKPVKEKFYAEVSKNTNVSTLLEMLAATKAVHFRMDGEKIMVSP